MGEPVRKDVAEPESPSIDDYVLPHNFGILRTFRQRFTLKSLNDSLSNKRKMRDVIAERYPNPLYLDVFKDLRRQVENGMPYHAAESECDKLFLEWSIDESKTPEESMYGGQSILRAFYDVFRNHPECRREYHAQENQKERAKNNLINVHLKK